jgi:hypothetical protein
MDARWLAIEERLRDEGDPRVVRPSDFRFRDAGAVDPALLLQNPDLTLYCLDFENRQALFLETPGDCDLTRVPFLYVAQYRHAVRAAAVPFPILHRLAGEAPITPSRLTLIYSTGRCGSTLVSRAYAQVKGVESLSEPDVFTQMLGTWGPGQNDDEEKLDLVRSCTLLQCAPGRAKGADAWALKFRSMVTEMWPLFYGAFPEARVVFLYRQLAPWARSFHRMMGSPDPAAPQPMAFMHYLFGRLAAMISSGESASPLEIMAAHWLRIMENCLEMQRAGLPVFLARYEELNAAPHDVLAAMLAHSGLEGATVGDLNAVLLQDSQAGTALSRESLGSGAVGLDARNIEDLRQLVEAASPSIAADGSLPGTYFPVVAGRANG